MKKNQFKLKTTDFKKIVLELKEVEKHTALPKLNGLDLSKFLMANLNLPKGDNVSIRTKRIILQIAGDFDSDPNDLADEMKLVKNLLYGDDEYQLLQIKLDLLVKEYKKDASIADNEASDCATVKDCLDLVNAKI